MRWTAGTIVKLTIFTQGLQRSYQPDVDYVRMLELSQGHVARAWHACKIDGTKVAHQKIEPLNKVGTNTDCSFEYPA